MSRSAILGVGLGVSDDGAEPVIVVLVDQAKANKARLKDRIENVRTKVTFTDTITAY